MKKIAMTALLCSLFCGCSTTIPGLTAHTDVPLEIKGYRTGMALTHCPTSIQKTWLLGRKLACSLDEKSLGGTAVTFAGVVVFDGRIVSITFQLARSAGFSQAGVVNSLTEKFGPPARTVSPVKGVIWRNGNDQLVVDEIAGTVILVDRQAAGALEEAEARAGSKDL